MVFFDILGAGLHVLYVYSNPKILTLLAISLEEVSSFMIDLELLFFLLDTKTKFHIGGTWCSYPYAITNIYSQEIQGIYPAPPESGLPKETGVASYL